MQSKYMSDKSIKDPPSSDNSFNLEINYFDNARILVKLDGNYLKQRSNVYT